MSYRTNLELSAVVKSHQIIEALEPEGADEFRDLRYLSIPQIPFRLRRGRASLLEGWRRVH